MTDRREGDPHPDSVPKDGTDVTPDSLPDASDYQTQDNDRPLDDIERPAPDSDRP
jgi:hypothetical protein